MRENLCKVSERLSKGEKEGDCIVLAVANIVSWLFSEFTRIKNEFIAFLNYSTEVIEPQKPENIYMKRHCGEWRL